jgi:hypothetical protein
MACLLLAGSIAAAYAHDRALPNEKMAGKIEQLVTFTGSMRTGVTVSKDNRAFVNFRRWADPVPFTIAEMKQGTPVAYPDADIYKLAPARAAETFISLQSVGVQGSARKTFSLFRIKIDGAGGASLMKFASIKKA